MKHVGQDSNHIEKQCSTRRVRRRAYDTEKQSKAICSRQQRLTPTAGPKPNTRTESQNPNTILKTQERHNPVKLEKTSQRWQDSDIIITNTDLVCVLHLHAERPADSDQLPLVMLLELA